MSTIVPSLSKETQRDPSTTAGDFSLDDNVINSFPTGLSANKFGYSKWSLTARVDIIHPDGTPTSYSLKCAVEDAGRVMMQGECHDMSDQNKTDARTGAEAPRLGQIFDDISGGILLLSRIYRHVPRPAGAPSTVR